MSPDRPRALVVYESMFSNTESIAAAVADGLRAGGCATQLADLRLAALAAPFDHDLLVIGAPTHGFSLSRPSTRQDAVRQGAPPGRAAIGVREWLGDLRVPAASRRPAVAAFDTRAARARRLPAAAVRIARRTSRLGLHLLTPPEGFLVEGTKGPLRAGETDRATAWGRGLARLVVATDPEPPPPPATAPQSSSDPLAGPRPTDRQPHVYDDVTGLPSTALFIDRLTMASHACERLGQQVGLICAGVGVEESSRGPVAPDLVAREVARRLSGAVRAVDTVARTGPSTFAVVLFGQGDDADVAMLARRILFELSPPLVLEGEEHFLRAHLGAASTDGTYDPQRLLERAERSLRVARDRDEPLIVSVATP